MDSWLPLIIDAGIIGIKLSVVTVLAAKRGICFILGAVPAAEQVKELKPVDEAWIDCGNGVNQGKYITI